MGKATGFLEVDRELPKHKSPEERILDYKEFYLDFPNKNTESQASRCMDCGVPFCHSGCPLGNIIPEFNDAVYRQDWKGAYEYLSSTNNFPEFTGRICPAPCEAACVLGINKPPVTIEHIEKTIIEKAFANGWVQPIKPEIRTGKKVAVVGSGPAGLAVAVQLNKAGHNVTVFERDDVGGGLLRYGIPDFKLDKAVVQRRIDVMIASGIDFKFNANVGVDVDIKKLEKEFDAIALTGGATAGRDLPIPGRELKGVYFAMEFLKDNSKRVQGSKILRDEPINVKGANVLVIGGGDTGSDCVGTSNRHKAKSITQIELLPKPGNSRGKEDAWPKWPNILRTSTSHKEGCERFWSINTKEFIGDGKGNLKGVKICDIEWETPEPGKRPGFKEVKGSERVVDAEFAFLSIGFVGPETDGMISQLGLELDERGNVKTDAKYQTSNEKVFSAGDMRTGQSLVVRCISEGRECARSIDEFLTGEVSNLEARDHSHFDLSRI